MRHRKSKVTLDRRSGPRRLLLRTLTTNVLLRERVRTTVAKAKAVRPLVEKCITISKQDTLIRRRKLMALLASPTMVEKLITVLGPKYRERPGGYTRTVRIGRRVGDGAEIVMIELV